jgi:hypothetical protein
MRAGPAVSTTPQSLQGILVAPQMLLHVFRRRRADRLQALLHQVLVLQRLVPRRRTAQQQAGKRHQHGRAPTAPDARGFVATASGQARSRPAPLAR